MRSEASSRQSAFGPHPVSLAREIVRNQRLKHDISNARFQPEQLAPPNTQKRAQWG